MDCGFIFQHFTIILTHYAKFNI